MSKPHGGLSQGGICAKGVPLRFRAANLRATTGDGRTGPARSKTTRVLPVGQMKGGYLKIEPRIEPDGHTAFRDVDRP